MDKHATCGTAEAVEAQAMMGARRREPCDLREGVDFSSRQAERTKMRLWLTACTAAAALAVLLVVSISVLHG